MKGVKKNLWLLAMASIAMFLMAACQNEQEEEESRYDEFTATLWKEEPRANFQGNYDVKGIVYSAPNTYAMTERKVLFRKGDKWVEVNMTQGKAPGSEVALALDGNNEVSLLTAINGGRVIIAAGGINGKYGIGIASGDKVTHAWGGFDQPTSIIAVPRADAKEMALLAFGGANLLSQSNDSAAKLAKNWDVAAFKYANDQSFDDAGQTQLLLDKQNNLYIGVTGTGYFEFKANDIGKATTERDNPAWKGKAEGFWKNDLPAAAAFTSGGLVVKTDAGLGFVPKGNMTGGGQAIRGAEEDKFGRFYRLKSIGEQVWALSQNGIFVIGANGELERQITQNLGGSNYKDADLQVIAQNKSALQAADLESANFVDWTRAGATTWVIAGNKIWRGETKKIKVKKEG